MNLEEVEFEKEIEKALSERKYLTEEEINFLYEELFFEETSELTEEEIEEIVSAIVKNPPF